jgi:hypothetical protein
MAAEKCNDNVITGAIALIKVNGKVIGKMKSVRYQENIRRLRVGGLGTIMPLEQPVTEWDATLNCEFMMIDLKQSAIPGALDRNFETAKSQALLGKESFEDNLVLECCKLPIQVDIFKKVCDVIDDKGRVKPKLQPIAIIPSVLIESNQFDISEGAISSSSQSFKVQEPLIVPSYLES